MMHWLKEAFSPEQRRIIGAEVQQSLNDRHWKEAFEAVESYLVGKAKSIDPKDKEAAANVVNCMQLLEAIRRELVRKIEDGEMAQVEIAELERQKRPLRFVR